MKRRFNWLDSICILLVGVLILGGVWYFTQREEPKKEREESPYIITFRCKQATDDEANFMKEGDILYFQGREKELGTILSLKVIDREVEEFNPHTGEYAKGIDPSEKMVELEVEAKGRLRREEFRVNDTLMNVGQTLYPETDHARVVATVWSIEEVAK
ncbi:MAG: DUF4330 family protein [Clostridia bacterium]|nr:DUF4330 family protein [Clostridia bacterium]